MPLHLENDKQLSVNGKLWVLATLALPMFVFVFNNFMIVLDNQQVRCLPERVYLVNNFIKPQKADYVYFSADVLRRVSKANYYLRPHDKIIKKIAGAPGDYLVIDHQGVWINGQLISTDLSDAELLYKTDESVFYKSEVIPQDSYFVIGTTKYSNDSRYWGYLTKRDVIGKATGIL